MNENLLGKCRACGQIVSKNLVNGCPHCGEAEPHLTEEVMRRRTEEQEREKEDTKEEGKKVAKRFQIGCLILIVLGIIFYFLFQAWLGMYDNMMKEAIGMTEYLEEVEHILVLQKQM